MPLLVLVNVDAAAEARCADAAAAVAAALGLENVCQGRPHKCVAAPVFGGAAGGAQPLCDALGWVVQPFAVPE